MCIRSLQYLLVCCPFFVDAQDYSKLAKDLQQTYKDNQAVYFSSDIRYDFEKDSKSFVKVTETKNEKLLSLRYNETLYQTEVYDNNSKLEKFFAESNLKQEAKNDDKTCGIYSSDGLFFDDSKFCTHELKLKEVGEIWDVTSVKKNQDAKYLATIFFEEKLPVLQRKIKLIIPVDIEMEIKEFNLAGYNVSKAETTNDKNRIIEYEIRDLNGLENEKFGRGLQFNHPHLLILLKSVNLSGTKTNILATSQDLYTWYSSLTKELKPDVEVIKPMVMSLIKDKTTDEEKIKAIYYWVQDNIRYIAFEDGIAGYKPDEAHRVFEKRYGDCKGMANLTKEMLKVAGYDARLTWIGTKRIMHDQTLPSLAVNNHMICTVILNGKKYFLDATEKYMPLGENAERIQNRQVMIEDGEKFIADKVTASDFNRDADERKVHAKIIGDNLEGTFKMDLKGEVKKNFLYSYHYTKTELRDEFVADFISRGNKNVVTKVGTLPDVNERSGPLSLEGQLTFSGAVSSFNTQYFVDIDPIKLFNDWIIKDTRQSDVDFGEKVNKKILIELQIPEGYSVSNLPESLKISDSEFSFVIDYKLAGDKILYTKELTIPDGLIRKQSFQKWNDAVKKLAAAYENQIVLTK
jgi:hypothetical protein